MAPKCFSELNVPGKKEEGQISSLDLQASLQVKTASGILLATQIAELRQLPRRQVRVGEAVRRRGRRVHDGNIPRDGRVGGKT